MTWFVDHDWPRWSDDSRTVQLGADFTTWRSRLLEAWPDAIRSQRVLQFELASPLPVGTSQDIVAHVILVQRPRPMKRAILLTIVDDAATVWAPPTYALSVSATLDHWELLYLAQVDQRCAPRTSPAICRSLWGARDLSSGHVFEVDSGMALTVEVHDPPLDVVLPVDTDLLDDAAAFIQLNIEKTIAIFETISVLEQDLSEPLGGEGHDPADRRFLQLSSLTSRFCTALETLLADLPAPEPAPSAASEEIAQSTLKRHPVVLELEHVLPRPTPPTDDNALIMHSATSDWQDRLQEADVQLVMLPDGVHLHPKTFDAMNVPEQYSEPSFAHNAVLFIDGSAAHGEAAWSVVCVRYDGLGIPSLFGMAAGLVDIVPTSTSWIGVQCADNLAAELTAFAHASVLALGVNFDTSVVIAPDLELSLLLAQDSCTCKAHPLLVTLLHCLGHSLHHQGHGVHPVRAHCGHPWNELADTLAKFALQCGTPIGRIHAPVLHEMMLHRDVMWTWVIHNNMMPLLTVCHHPLNRDSGILLRQPRNLRHRFRRCTKPYLRKCASWRSRQTFLRWTRLSRSNRPSTVLVQLALISNGINNMLR